MDYEKKAAAEMMNRLVALQGMFIPNAIADRIGIGGQLR